jgi:Mn2+/Fe2+ NRAMP family transporter
VVTGIFGTTISPYLFFWQASEEVEDMQAAHQRALLRDGKAAPRELRRIRWDTWSGMFYSNLTAYFIILATGVTLHVAGVTDIKSAADAARTLGPVAGPGAKYVFALGIFGVGLIGVPVLAGSGAYALAEAMGWKEGLERKATDARGFYAVISVSVLAALVIQFSPIDPMKALFWSAVINGVTQVGAGRLPRWPHPSHTRLDRDGRDAADGARDVPAGAISPSPSWGGTDLEAVRWGSAMTATV